MPLCSLQQVLRAQSFDACVIGVSDGDTVTVLHDNQPEKIRLAEIDCPEKKQAFGTRAKQFTANFVFNKTVTVDPQKKDRYGRTIANIYLSDGRHLNYEIVKAGYAWLYTAYSHDPKIAQAESQARASRLGLWQDPTPTAPWQYRKDKRNHAVTTLR